MYFKLSSYQCDICGDYFTEKLKLQKHLDKHRNLKCNVCGRSYQTLNNLKYHLKLHFDENYFIICDICGRSVSKWKLRRHIERHNPDTSQTKNNKSYDCRFCGIKFTKNNNRTTHEQRIHRHKSNLGLENFKCKDCFQKFLSKEELRIHSFEHFNGKIHQCDFPGCNRYFKKRKLLTVHKRCHYEPQFKCVDCGSLFVQKAGLTKHQKNRCPTKKVKERPTNEELEKLAEVAKEQFVNLRGRISNNSSKLKKTIKNYVVQDNSVHSEDKVNFEHSIVTQDAKIENIVVEDWEYEFLDEAFSELNAVENSRIFAESLTVKQDEITQNENETELTSLNSQYIVLKEPNTVNSKSNDLQKNFFACDFCGKSNIRKKSDLHKHLLSHRTENGHKKIHICNEMGCKEAFSTKTLLNQHRRGYHSLKIVDRKTSEPYICDYCGKNYWTRSSIATHLLVTHKTIADFKCKDCCRQFKSHGNLVRHVRTVHLEKKLFGCEKCGAMFKEKYQLETHIHNHDEPTECNLCGRMVSNLKVHLRHHARKVNNTIVKCPMCEKLIGKYQLVRHIKSVHEKQYQCDSTKSNLKIYTCKTCGEFFSRQQELRQHEYINHSQSKIYKCSVCGTYFKTVKLLNVHRFSHQPLNLACEYCNNVYARRGALWKHQKKKHSELLMKKNSEEKNTIKS